jgi:murein DD-endopeptidase MepM/ murein hydrolase activator NlpD
MINRDLMQRQMFRNGGGVVPMQDGGEPTFRERIEALSKAAGRSIEGLMEPNRAPYENMNPIQDPSAPMNLSPEEQAARRAQYEIQQGRFTQAEIDQILRNNPEYGDYGSMEGAPRYDLPTPSGPRRTEDNDPGFIQRILDYARDGYTLSNDTPIRQPVQEPVPEQNYRNGGPVYYMQEGGMAPMGMPPQGMPPPGAMMPEMAQAQQAGMDPAILEQMLAQASQGIGSLDEAEDYEQVMNMMTGTSATIAERRMELADLVGDEDAQQTPDSVLTLVQPVIMMAKTDEGIGGLAQDQMTEAVTGDMAGGIMSTIDMGAQEGPAPVNFRYGGAVQYFAPVNANRVAMNEQQQQDYDLLQQDYELNKNFMGQLIDKDAQAKAMQGQRDMTQAQMLFDLANTGLAIAAPGPRTMSVAEKLAYAAQQTELFPRIGARAAELGKFKQEQDQESRQYDLAAAQGAMTERSARRADERELAAAIAKEKRDLADAIAKKDRKFQVVNGALYEVIGADLVKVIDKIEDPQNFGSGVLGNAINTLTGDDAVDLATRYGDGKTTEAENNRIEFSLAIYTAPVPVYDKELNKDVLSPGNELPNLWKNAKNKRTGNVDTLSNVATPSNVDGTIPAYLRKPPVGADQVSTDQGGNDKDKRNIEIEGPTYDSLISEMDNLSGDITGKSSALKNMANRTSEFFSGSLFFPQAEKTQSLVDSLNTVASMVLMRTQVNDRPPDSFRKEVKKIFPKTGEFFKGSENALNKLNNIVAFFNAEIGINNARDWASVKPEQQLAIQEQGAMLETYRDTYLSLRDRLAAEENKGQGNKPDFRQYLSPEARKEWEKKYGKDGEKKKLTLDAPSSPGMRQPEPRKIVPTQLNTVRPEAVLSVEQPPVPETILAGIEPFVPEAPSVSGMRQPEPRKIVPTQLNTVRPEAVLSVDKPPVPENNETFEARKGKLRLPALGTVTAKFGERRVDSNVPWEGIFISSDQGTSVNSIAGGTVVYSDWLRGFGNLIIIDHGEGYSSLYGNNEDLWAREGDQIEAGDQLGTVGNSGGNTGPGVYFEVRHNSKLLNPMEWVNIDEAKLKD